jgi:tmRNA-binding protein
MSFEEEEQYLGELHMRRLVEVALLEHEQERQRRMLEGIQEQGRGIQWLRTREREDFPTYSLCLRRHSFSY